MINYPIKYKQSIHEKEIVNYLGKNKTFVKDKDLRFNKIKVILLCFSNRSGSNFLSEGIAQGNITNIAGENLNFNTVINNCKNKKLSTFADYLYWLVNFQKKEEHKYFSVKASLDQLVFLYNYGILQNCFYNLKIIHIQRSDILAQAISLYKAIQSDQWTSYQEASNENIQFNEAQIIDIMKKIEEDKGMFNCFFTLTGVKLCRVKYEALLIDPIETFSKIYKYLDLIFSDDCFSYDKLKSKKQSNEINDKFRRLINEKYNLNFS